MWQSKTQLYLRNIQGVSVYTNVSANYMFRPLLVRPSSGWIQWSEELYMVKVPCVWPGDTRNTIMCDKGQGNTKGGR